MRSALAIALAAFALMMSSWAMAPAAHAADPAPTTVTVSAPSFRPAPDGVEDTVTITATVDPAVPSVVLAVEPNVASWTLTPDPVTHQVSVVWDGKGNNGPDGLAPPGVHTISANAWGYTGTGLLVGTAVTTVNVQIDTLSANVAFRLKGQDGLVKSFNGRCGKLVKPSAHHWQGSVGFYADARCNRGGLKNSSDGLYAIRPLGSFSGHTVHDYSTVQVSVYGAAAPGSYRRSVGLLAMRTRNGKFYGAPTKLRAKLGWHAGPAVPATAVMASDHSFAWDIGTLGHTRYDVRALVVTVGYTYLY